MRSERVRVGLLLVLLAVLASGSGLLTRIDHLVFDVGQRLLRNVVPSDVLIIAIDEDSLDRLGRWPWPRTWHARLLQTLCASKPAALGFDIAFSEPSDDPLTDLLLAEAMAACGNVVLPLVIESTRLGGQLLESPPIRPLAAAAAAIGRIGVRLDEDGIARSVDLREGVGAAAWPLLAEELLRVAGKLPPQYAATSLPEAVEEAGQQLVREDLRRVEFIGPPGTVPRFSYVSALEGTIAPEMLTGKIVLIGVTATGLGDYVPTPVSGLGQPMPGVEVLANVLLAMRDQRLIVSLAMPPTLLLAALLAIVPLLWLPLLRALPGLLASTAWVIVLGVVCALLPALLQVWFAPGGTLLAGLFACPLWSWRRLEAASRYLDQELRVLEAMLPDRVARPDELTPSRRLGFEQRIALVQGALRAMQALEARRSEALAFISHDLRVPLASAVEELESDTGADRERLLSQLRRALAMAQAFVWLARAEVLDRRRMKVLELTSLLHQAADVLYALARQRQSRIVGHLPDSPVWIKGDFELLERSAINLLHNAIIHAPPGTLIGIGLDVDDEAVRFWVENDGDPLSEQVLARLFQRFSRGEHVAPKSSNTGLGLFFVRTVAERHGGQAGVECRAGKIRFYMALRAAEAQAPVPPGGRDHPARRHFER